MLGNLSDLGYLHHDAANRTFPPSIRIALLGRALLMPKPDHQVLSLVRRSNAGAEDDREPVMPFRSPMGHEPMSVGVGGTSADIRCKRLRVLSALRTFKANYDA